MHVFRELFASPELYPLRVDFSAGSVSFVRMTRLAYQSSLFASFRAARRFGDESYEIRLDDVLLASRSGSGLKRTVYILHTAYCCSTLLARYFELFPSSFVLKEPPLLAQIANTHHLSQARWQEVLNLSVRLLTRTYSSHDTAVIKTHVPSNMIGRQLLEHNRLASVIYLFTPLRSFLLAVLKSGKRRERIRVWNTEVSRVSHRHAELADVPIEQLNDAQAAAYWWLMTRFLCHELCASHDSRRVYIVNGEELAECPEAVLPVLMEAYGIGPNEQLSREILIHPSLRIHSKHPQQQFDGSMIRSEIADLESSYGAEADSAMNWMVSRGLTWELPVVESFGTGVLGSSGSNQG